MPSFSPAKSLPAASEPRRANPDLGVSGQLGQPCQRTGRELSEVKVLAFGRGIIYEAHAGKEQRSGCELG
jgi:hypothetical protein